MIDKILDSISKEYKSKNAEIAVYKALLYRLVNAQNLKELEEFIEYRLDLILHNNDNLSATTDVSTFLNNLAKDKDKEAEKKSYRENE